MVCMYMCMCVCMCVYACVYVCVCGEGGGLDKQTISQQCVCMVCVYGVHVYVHVCVHGVHVWCACVGCMVSMYMCMCVCMVCMYDVHV